MTPSLSKRIGRTWRMKPAKDWGLLGMVSKNEKLHIVFDTNVLKNINCDLNYFSLNETFKKQMTL